jgi:hypothetical protein
VDTLAFEFALRHVGRELTEDEQRRSSFPIFDQAAKYDQFFADRRDH